MKILATKRCNNKSYDCKYCQGSGIVYILAQVKIPNKKTQTIKYYFNDANDDSMIRFCKCKCKIKDCEFCKGTGIHSIYMENQDYHLKQYDSPKRIKCNNCTGKNCVKCRGYGFTSVFLEEGLIIETKQNYQVKTIKEANLCQACLRSLNASGCELCHGRGKVLKNLQICGNCSGYGIVVKHFRNQYKYKKCKNCGGAGAPTKSFLDLNLEECKNVIRRVLNFKEFLFDIKLKSKQIMNGQEHEFLYSDVIMIDRAILNNSSYPLVFMALKNSFTSLRLLEDRLQENFSKIRTDNRGLKMLQFYTIKKFANWSHHSTMTKERSGFVINEKDLLSTLDLFEDLIKKSFSSENNEIPILDSVEVYKQKQPKWMESNLKRVDINLKRFLINRIQENEIENVNFHNFLMYSKK
ncbi:ssu-2 [Anaeramoeba flamelloides]|uniref:Ssu-2 n=1 Tax=Anaeramoeba flamelloides TaxID=1746091 RepID=A0ABQ8XFK8_9EUKA|nr:ssu-2 [Anaeramoeba flamelloides]